MSISYSFVDNKMYGTDDINDITRSLTGAGVAPFLSKDSYTVSDLNALTGALVESGVQLDGCKCSIRTADRKNIITVGEGVVFFENGVRLTVDGDKYHVEVNVNEPGYVFAEFNTALQTADIVFAAQLPQNGIIVCLAEVNEKNEIKDVRKIACSKIGTLGKNVTYETTITASFNPKTSKPYKEPGRYALAKIDVDLSKFNLVYIKWLGSSASGSGAGGIFDLKKNRFLVSAYGGTHVSGYFDTSKIFEYNDTDFGFEIVDGVLTYYGDCGSESTYGIEVNCDRVFGLLFV